MKKCKTCGREINEEDLYCPHCGSKQFIEEVKKEEVKEPAHKKKSVALVLALFLGCFGIDDLYLGKKTSFYVKFGLAFVSMGLLLPILMIVGFVDFFIILFNKNIKDGYGRNLLWKK